MPKSRVTLKDVARATGVHVSTVSRALNPKPSASLTDEIVQRVREAAAAMGYRPNLSAYGLRTSNTMTVGVLIPDITNLIFPPILRGIESVIEPLGYAALIVNTDNQPQREAALLDSLLGRSVDGIIHAGVGQDSKLFTSDAMHGVPMVTVNRRIDSADIPSVVNDDDSGIRSVFQHLVDLGHRRIGHIAGPRSSSTGALRKRAFLAELRNRRQECAVGSVVEASAYDEASGAACAAEILQKDPETTAILCANDRLAIGALGLLRERGLSCPGDISLTGFNDMPMLEMIQPGLTTIHINSYEIGRVAGALLIRMMSAPEEVVPSQTIMPVSLIVRNSTAEPRQI